MQAAALISSAPGNPPSHAAAAHHHTRFNKQVSMPMPQPQPQPQPQRRLAATSSTSAPGSILDSSITQAESRKKMLAGYENFIRENPRSDKFPVLGFDHVELWCGDAANTWRRFSWGLGLSLVAKSDQSTGNHSYCSYVLASHDLKFVFSAPYSENAPRPEPSRLRIPHPGSNPAHMSQFFETHGLGVRAVGLRVGSSAQAFEASVASGAIPVQRPELLLDPASGGSLQISEVLLYGDVVLRFLSGDFPGDFLPGYDPVEEPGGGSIGLRRLDHAVGNVEDLLRAAEYIAGFTGFHEFAEFTAEDVGTGESGLNSLVLASNDERVLLPINEPVHGTKRKSQIQTYLEQNEGPGLQHLAIACDDIFETLREMRMRSGLGGFEFMPRPGKKYYRDLPGRIGDGLTREQVEMCEELGILVDRDDQGILLQIFTKPVGDRPTLFLEIIQRIGCEEEGEQRAGCGGFGKGNFAALFKSIEDFEKTLDGTL